MRTNLTPTLMEEEFLYDYSGNEIKQKSDPAVIYTIEEMSDSLLLFSMTISKIPFRLQMKKALPPAPREPTIGDTL